MYFTLACLAFVVFTYSLISDRIERLSLSGPIVFVALGVALGPLGLEWFSPTGEAFNGKAIIDITLALFLFVDAANANLGVLRGSWRLPGRMLLLGLPGSIFIGGACAVLLFPTLSLYEAAILGTILAATDAALGKAVVTNQSVPSHLRESLSAESGLNDGLCVPVLLFFIALEQGAATRGEGLALELLSEEIGIGVLVGAVLSLIAARAVLMARAAGWLGPIWQRMSVPALALLIFAVAQALHGSGYIAAFVGGLCFRGAMKQDVHSMLLPAESAAELLAMFAWMTFGMMLVPAALPFIGWAEVLYAVLSLTVIRMLPIMLSLSGTREPLSSRAFLAWFGPRGLASLAFATIVWSEQLPASGTLMAVTIVTVGISLVVHGVTARPFARRLAASYTE
ncbi:MAG: sodium:proton antiporter [Halieaceae bacterium]|jgi:NhaP-type Na+/H+ or K+/H+ antiporter|nr:MAG: sodium:proton antiporter [Halieaceae bacterium]